MLGLKNNELKLVPFNPEWIAAYNKEKLVLSIIFGSNSNGIHHIGSTAIEGTLAKPILDIAMDVNDLRGINITGLEAAGYKFVGEHGIPGRLLFIKRRDGDVTTHHLHCFQNGHQGLKDNLLFRDFLLKNPTYVRIYNTQKLILLEKHNGNREKYTEGKAGFINHVIRLAKKNPLS